MPAALAIKARGLYGLRRLPRRREGTKKRLEDSQCDAFLKVVLACGAGYRGTVPACHGATAMCVGMVGNHPLTKP